MMDVDEGSTESPAMACPPEILHHIFSFLLTDEVEFSTSNNHVVAEPGRIHHRTFLPIMMVSRSWFETGSTLLYSDLCLSEPGQLFHILEYCRHRLGSVRHIRIVWNRQPMVLPDPELQSLPILLHECNDTLRYLTLCGEQFDFSDPNLMSALGSCNGIKGFSCVGLEVAFYSQRAGPQSRRTGRNISSFLSAMPSLKEARFDEFRSAYGMDVEPFVGTGLETLELHQVVLEDRNLRSLFEPLRGGRLKSLTLERGSLSTSETFKDILEMVGERLERLTILDCEVLQTWTSTNDRHSLLDSIISHCPRLNHLKVACKLDRLPPRFEVPNGIKHLEIDSVYITPSKVRTGIERGNFPELRSLKVGEQHSQAWRAGLGDDGDGEVGRVVEVCERLGVRLDVPGRRA